MRVGFFAVGNTVIIYVATQLAMGKVKLHRLICLRFGIALKKCRRLMNNPIWRHDEPRLLFYLPNDRFLNCFTFF